MTVLDLRPTTAPPLSRHRASPPARLGLYQRVSTRSWNRLTTVITVLVVVISTALAVVIALKAPSISPVAPPPTGVAVAADPVPTPSVPLRGLVDGLRGPGSGGRHR